MCKCEACQAWKRNARGFQGGKKCINKDHCACCDDWSKDCSHCNHFDIPLIMDSAAIHYHANLHIKPPFEFQNEVDEDWILLTNLKI